MFFVLLGGFMSFEFWWNIGFVVLKEENVRAEGTVVSPLVIRQCFNIYGYIHFYYIYIHIY